MLGVSMAPSSIQMVVLEGEYADGATVEEDAIDVTGADDAATASAPDRVISAILGTREGAADAGLQLSSIGVTWTDQLEAAALRDALAARRIDNVMLVSAFLAAAALAQNVGGAMGYERTAVLLVEPDTATLAVVETSDGSIPDVYKQQIRAESYGDAAGQLSAMVAGLEKLESLPGGLLLVGSGVDVAPLKQVLQTTTFLDVSVAEEPETALARGPPWPRRTRRCSRRRRRRWPTHKTPAPALSTSTRCPTTSMSPSIPSPATTNSPTARWGRRTPSRRPWSSRSCSFPRTVSRVDGRSCWWAAGWRWSASARCWRWRSRWRSASAPPEPWRCNLPRINI
ncbi:hypothetical protein I549_1098 [Mycobacterium avium subsp. avium 2285 (R)]|nr:hypothetical protein I549_1098 [Mycobacterium avium subsp. avium 2285 (R)]